MQQVTSQVDIREVNDLVQRESAFVDQILSEAGKVVVGQKPMLERLLIGLLTGGHVLLEGVPGLAKTLTVKTLADTMDASSPPAPSRPCTRAHPGGSPTASSSSQRSSRARPAASGPPSPVKASPTAVAWARAQATQSARSAARAA